MASSCGIFGEGSVVNSERERVVYREEVISQTNRISSIVMGVLALGLFGALVKELISPSATYAWAITLGFSGFFAVVAASRLLIRRLKITVTNKALTVAFIFLQETVPLTSIAGCSIDENVNKAYRAQGMYQRNVDGNRTWIYSASRAPKVVLDLKEGGYKRLVFSSNQPEEVTAILAGQLK